MNKLAELLRSPVPESEQENNWSAYEAPGESSDLRRILAIPRKQEPAPEVAQALVEQYTAVLKRPAGTMKLRPIQALALHEALTAGGLLGAIGVGEGKTLIAMLLATVLGAKRTVLLIPPQLRDQIINKAHPALAKHWRIPNLSVSQGGMAYPDVDGVLHVVAYSELSSARTADLLERLQPDLVVCDEAHNVRNISASRTKRFNRFFKAHPTTKLCALSGTLISKSVRDFAHLSKFALRAGSPLPLDWPTLQAWAEALDPSDWTPPAGELERLCNPGEDVRSGFRRRLLSTPGFVATLENKVGASLVFYQRELELPPEMRQALANLRASWSIGEEEIQDALTFSRYARQLAAGLYLRWIWPRGESLELRTEWVERRKYWHKEVRERLKASIPGQDSPLLCARAAQSGQWSCDAWEPWSEIKGEARPETEAVWVSDYLVEDAVAWGRENAGIIWYEHDALGEAIAARGGFPLFNADRRRILDESGKRSIVASRRVFYQGFDGLQHRFNKMLVTTTSSSAEIWEQTLGRLHREGTEADEVEVHAYLHTTEMRDAFEAARKAACFIEEIKGERQRLSYAQLTF